MSDAQNDSVGERPSASSMQGVVEDWASFDVRASGPPMSAVERYIAPPEVHPAISDLLVELQQSLAEPVRGITSDGTVIAGLQGTAGRTSTAVIREPVDKPATMPVTSQSSGC